MHDFHRSTNQNHPCPDCKPNQELWLCSAFALYTKTDSVDSPNPPIIPEYMAITLAQGVRAIRGFLDLRQPKSWSLDERIALVLGHTETVARNVVRPVPATEEGTTISGGPVCSDDSGRSRMGDKMLFSWRPTVQRRSPPFVTARAMRLAVAAWNEAVRLSMDEHRERMRVLGVNVGWPSSWAAGCSQRTEGAASIASLEKLRRRGKVGIRNGRWYDDSELGFAREIWRRQITLEWTTDDCDWQWWIECVRKQAFRGISYLFRTGASSSYIGEVIESGSSIVLAHCSWPTYRS